VTYQVRLKPIFVWTLNFALSKAWVGIKAFAGVVVSLVSATLATLYARHNFAVNTNFSGLIFSNLRWRQRELTYQARPPEKPAVDRRFIPGVDPELAIRDLPFCCH
jgi:hypothetical protein